MAVTEFINSILQCPLPESALLSLQNFLGITMVSCEVWDALDDVEVEKIRTKSRQLLLDDSLLDYTAKISGYEGPHPLGIVANDAENSRALSDRCFFELMHAEKIGKLATDLTAVPLRHPHPSACIAPKFFRPNHATNHHHETVRAALTNVMAERDASRAQLIATSAFHVCAMDQERMKSASLSAKVEYLARKLQQRPQKKGGTFFGGFDKNTRKKKDQNESLGKEHIELKEKEPNELELEIKKLCHQLSGEISCRGKADLEVIGLKERRDIERRFEASERAALHAEIAKLNEALAQEMQKVQRAENEAEKWRACYENIAGVRK